MTLSEARKLIEDCAKQMNDRYGQVVFDEWAIVSLAQDQARILSYVGPRNDTFLKNFANDLGTLRAELVKPQYNAGDFEFARHATGTSFEGFVEMGTGIYLICNNTKASMNEIAQNPRWLNAQVPFAEFAEKVRANPLSLTPE
ncbi:MAG TPA: hypothetical protein PLH97_02095 [Verrucomicrobiota bacterium]|nr:hypothetical protein [Verrucomicrobiota bacterium]